MDKNYISAHIRRTDHINLAKKHNCYTDDDEFINFLDKSNKNIYIATDNETTYNKFKQKYPKLSQSIQIYNISKKFTTVFITKKLDYGINSFVLYI